MRSYDNLICPRCGCKLSRNGGSLYCFFKHCYDIASSGYVNLVLSGSKTQLNSGDNKDMMLARRRTMDRGYYEALANKIVEIIADYSHDDILDIGCGEGYITGEIARAYESANVRGADLSKSAILLADKRYKNASFIVGNSASLPILEKSVDVGVAVFTPTYFAELERVVKRGGIFIKVNPAPEHLLDVKELLYEDTYLNEEEIVECGGFELIARYKLDDTFTACGDEIKDLLQMTPYYYHTPKESIERVSAMDKVTTRLSYDIKVYKRNEA
ncbi:MAG: methyltransferase domain-containing protein [Clostridia bacterium]|nr:methyltransferase domain-containing protein [Clostridia bacterium]